MVVYGQKMLYSDKVVVFGQSGRIREKWSYSGKVVVIGQNGCIRVKVVVFGQSGFIRVQVVVIWQKCLYSGKSDCSRAN